MVWLVLLGGIQILGLGFALARRAFAEWQQVRASRKARAAQEDRPRRMEYELWKTATT